MSRSSSEYEKNIIMIQKGSGLLGPGSFLKQQMLLREIYLRRQ